MRFVRLTAALLVLVLLCGCTGLFQKNPVQFYYLRDEITFTNSTSVIASEAATEFDDAMTLTEVLELYLTGPNDDALRSPFPEGVELVSVKQDGDTIFLKFNDHLSSLTGMDLTLACACVTMTCLELTDAVNVSIRAEGTTLDGAAQIKMNADSLILLDASGQ